MESLKDLRKEIDEIDNAIALMIERRLEVVREIGEIKKQSKMAIEDLNREEDILRRIRSLIKNQDNVNAIEEIYNAIFRISKKQQL